MDMQVHRMVGRHPAVEGVLQGTLPQSVAVVRGGRIQCPHISS